MKKPRNIETKNLTGLIALLILLIIGFACTINTGDGADNDHKKSGATKSESSKSLSNDDITSLKKATATKSSKKSGATSANEDQGDFIPVYAEIGNEKYFDFNQNFKEQKVIETITDNLNAALALPTDVNVTFRDCGQINAWYQPSSKTITMCYEFMEYFYDKSIAMGKTEEEADNIMTGATLFFFFHELGHCLIDVYDLPATGREEDAVDQLSTYILMDELDEEGQTAAGAGVLMFNAMAQEEQTSESAFADEHSLSSQRFYNLVCWMYGRDQEKYSFFVQEEILPEARAVRCPTEYGKMSSAWQRLTEPWIKK